ncbi:MAG: hypothetical protein ACFFD2_16695 [Promethearchaeota archaeon]
MMPLCGISSTLLLPRVLHAGGAGVYSPSVLSETGGTAMSKFALP